MNYQQRMAIVFILFAWVAIFATMQGCIRLPAPEQYEGEEAFTVVCSSSQAEYRFRSFSCVGHEGYFWFDQGRSNGACFCVKEGAIR